MKRIIKISGESCSGKSHLLQMIVAVEGVRNCIVVNGESSLQGILQLVRSRENVTLLIDECPAELLAELEAITEHSAVWGRIGCVYAVVREPVIELPARRKPTSWQSYDNHHNQMLDVFQKAADAAGVKVAIGGEHG